MRKGKKITASSLLTILGVVCFATILVGAVAISSSLITTNARDAKPLVMSLGTLSDGAGAPSFWDVSGDALVDQVYDMQFTATTTWTGNYAITVSVDATEALTLGTEVTMAYKAPGDSGFTTILASGAGGWTADAGVLSFALPTEAASGTYSGTYEFTIECNTTLNDVSVSFVANSV